MFFNIIYYFMKKSPVIGGFGMSLENINNKIINNAVSAYLMLFISWMLLINKSNPYINNDFVKNHTKSSIITSTLNSL